MSVAIRRSMTIDEFLAWEADQELRWEFDGFAPVAMTGGTVGRSAIRRDLISALAPRLRGNGATMFERSGDDWVGHVLGADAVLVMPEIGIEVALAECYEGVVPEPAEQNERDG